jgi:hypothetical protein
MLALLTMLFSSSRRTVCTPCLLFLRKIEIKRKSDNNSKILIFFKNKKQDVETVRLDELNNIVSKANISFIFQN